MIDTFLVAKHTLLRGNYMRQLRVSPADNSVITTRPKDDTAVTNAWPADSIVAVESKSGLRFDVVLHPVCGVFPRRLQLRERSELGVDGDAASRALHAACCLYSPAEPGYLGAALPRAARRESG